MKVCLPEKNVDFIVIQIYFLDEKRQAGTFSDERAFCQQTLKGIAWRKNGGIVFFKMHMAYCMNDERVQFADLPFTVLAMGIPYIFF